MPYSMVMHWTDGVYEPGERYYLLSPPASPAVLAGQLAEYQAPVKSLTWHGTRWVLLDSDGVKVEENSFVRVGEYGGSQLPPKYCTFWRLNSAGPGKPSCKYLHGLSEEMMAGGLPEDDYLAALAAFATNLIGANVCDSDGFALTGATFRQFSFRRHVQLLVTS